MGTMSMVLLLVVMLALLGAGVWIGIALLGVAWFAVAFFTSKLAGDSMVLAVWSSMSSWILTALPLFIWMGEILLKTRLSEGMFKGLAPWMQALPGRLLHVNVLGCTIFASATGSSAATCAMVGKISLPELKKRGYPERISVGSLAGAGTLGLMIPPSIMMIVYGVATDVSIGKLFIAGVIPGLMIAGLFFSYVALWSIFNKDKIPPADAPMSFREKVRNSAELLPVVVLVVIVLGSIYGGYATPTEAASVGVVGGFLLAASQGELTWKMFRESLESATRLYCMIALILAGSAFLTLSMGFIGLPRVTAEWIGSLNLSPTMLLLALLVFYIILGCFLDGISLIVLTTAVLLPTLHAAGIDLLWFGIFVVIVVEMAQITPPVGFNLFVIQGMTGKQLTYIAYAALPYFLLMLLSLALLWMFPALVTALPNNMN